MVTCSKRLGLGVATIVALLAVSFVTPKPGDAQSAQAGAGGVVVDLDAMEGASDAPSAHPPVSPYPRRMPDGRRPTSQFHLEVDPRPSRPIAPRPVENRPSTARERPSTAEQVARTAVPAPAPRPIEFATLPPPPRAPREAATATAGGEAEPEMGGTAETPPPVPSTRGTARVAEAPPEERELPEPSQAEGNIGEGAQPSTSTVEPSAAEMESPASPELASSASALASIPNAATNAESPAAGAAAPADRPTPADQQAALPTEMEADAVPPTRDRSALAADAISIRFFADETALPTDAEAPLAQLVQDIRDQEAVRIQLLAYAGGQGISQSQARRRSLSRALAVRKFLLDSGIETNRIDVRALGDTSSEGIPDRVDVQVVER